jgi:hypothetical protein
MRADDNPEKMRELTDEELAAIQDALTGLLTTATPRRELFALSDFLGRTMPDGSIHD